MSAPPMYDATALMPIRARVLRSPASKAADEVLDRVGRRQRLGAARARRARPPARSRAADGRPSRRRRGASPSRGRRGRRRHRRRGPSGRAGPRRSARCGRHPAARIDGIGSRSSENAASLSSRISTPASDAATAARASRSSAASRPAGPSAAGQVASSRWMRRPPVASRVEQAGEVRDDRAGQPQGPRPARRSAEERRPTAELHAQVHDDPLALRVDRRVRDLGERLAEVVGDRAVEPPAAGRRRVVAHAPQRLVRLERHRLDVESGALGVEAGQVAERRGRAGAPRGRRRRPPPRRGPRTIGRGASWIGSERSTCAFASVSSRIARRPGSTSRSSPGPEAAATDRLGGGRAGWRRPRTPPTTRRSRVTANDAGRSPLRSTSAPTRTPSAKTIAAGPSQGARNPAVRRRSVATCGCGERRSASASGIAASSAGVSSQPVVVSSSSASSSESESEPSGERSGPAASSSSATAFAPRSPRPAADLLAIAADRVDLAVVGDRAERLGEPPDRVRVRRVALVEDRVAERQRGAQVREELRQPGAGDQALVDDGPARRRRDGQARPERRHRRLADRGLERGVGR